MYITYEEYAAMGGGADAAAFERYALRAAGLIDRLTHGRLREGAPQQALEKARMAMFELIELRAQADGDLGLRGVAAMENDGVSVRYAGAEAEKARQRECRRIVLEHLEGARDAAGGALLYAGVGE